MRVLVLNFRFLPVNLKIFKGDILLFFLLFPFFIFIFAYFFPYFWAMAISSAMSLNIKLKFQILLSVFLFVFVGFCAVYCYAIDTDHTLYLLFLAGYVIGTPLWVLHFYLNERTSKVRFYTGLVATLFIIWEIGVGLSNVIGRVLAIIALLLILIFKLKIHLKLREMIALEKEVVKKILNIGGFSAGENLLWIVQYTIVFAFVASLGKENLSVQTIYFQISMMIMLIGQAISVANEIIIGKLVGARYFNIAYKHTWVALYLSIVASLAVALLNFILQDFTMGVLKLEDVLKELMIPLFMLSIFLEVFRSFNIVMVNALRASGDAKFPFFSGLIFMMGVSLPVGYALCFYAGLGIVGVWLGFCADEFLRCLVNAYRWKSKKWQGKALV